MIPSSFSRLNVPRLAGAILLAAAAFMPLARAAEPRRVVTLHPVLTQIAREGGGDAVTVVPLLRPGVDPHVFEPAPADIRRVREADLVLAAGLGMETYLPRLRRDLPADRVVEVGNRIPHPVQVCTADHGHEGHGHAHDHDHGEDDPHWWVAVDPLLAAIDIVTTELAARRPAAASAIQTRAAAYRARIAALKPWAQAEIARIPEAQRLLVTSHDAFRYLAREYGLEVQPLLGLSTADETSARRLADTIELIRQRGLRSVFAEASANDRTLAAIARETGAKPGRPLCADGLGGQPGTDTIEGMIRHNILAIAEGLR
ncbi:MAG: metal ABC transporter substrate-binding protein [Opitutaceae bacterium]